MIFPKKNNRKSTDKCKQSQMTKNSEKKNDISGFQMSADIFTATTSQDAAVTFYYFYFFIYLFGLNG